MISQTFQQNDHHDSSTNYNALKLIFHHLTPRSPLVIKVVSKSGFMLFVQYTCHFKSTYQPGSVEPL